MSDTLSALIGILIVLAIALVAWRLARQARRQSEDAYASSDPGAGEHGNKSGRQPGMTVTDQTVFQQHSTTRSTWDVASHGGDGPS